MKTNPLLKLESFGQSIWMDFIRRGMLDSGELARFIEQDGVLGVTSNPSIFEKAIAETHDYEAQILTLALQGESAAAIYQALTVDDIRRAADLFRPTYDRLDGRDGFVSLEVSPHLAHDTAATLAEARELWAYVDRSNVFIKVPATREGLPAIQQLIGEGVNVNITLLFGLDRYRQVAEAYLAGLERLASRRMPLERAASVASFFLSRLDTLVDPQLEKIRSQGGPAAALADGLQGELAIASARAAYRIYREIFTGERFARLAGLGARPQRLLWASTSTKNPAYRDVKYVEALIGPETINTLPVETLEAYRDHGDPAPRLEQGMGAAGQVLERLSQAGIDLEAVTRQLEDEGVEKFNRAFDQLMASIEQKKAAAARSTAASRLHVSTKG
jgi:transaldolase